MASHSVTIRFFLAQKVASDPPFTWGNQPILRDLLHAKLPDVAANGVIVSHEGFNHLVETTGHTVGSALHVQIARDLDEVPAARDHLKTGPITMQPGEVPASVTHLTFLPSGVVAVVRGITAPGPFQAAAILRQETGVPFRLEPLVRSDQIQVLNDANGASKLEFTARMVDPQLAAGDPLLESARRLTGLLDYEVSVKVVARRAVAKGTLRSFARKLIEGQASEDLKLARAKATLSGTSDGVGARVVDLLEDQIVERRVIQLPVPDGQGLATLTADEVLEAVSDAYNQLLVVVGSALAITPSDFPE